MALAGDIEETIMIRIATAAAFAAAFAMAPLAAYAAPADGMTRQERVEKRTENLQKRFDRLDVNKDGVVTHEEAEAPLVKAFDRVDANKDGVIDAKERAAAVAAMKVRAEKAGGDGSRIEKRMTRFERRDGDKDGNVTRAEFLAKAAPWFARADADKDGRVTKDELAALTTRMQKRAERATDKSAN